MSITPGLVEVTLSARVAFSKRSWPFVLATAVPWLLCAGQRSLTRLSSLGLLRRSRSAYYRFLSDGKWRLELFWRALFELIVRTFHLKEVTLVLDDTLCPKWGHKIFGTAPFFDHVRRPRPGFIWGHNWIVLAAVVPLGRGGWVALPFWIELYRNRKGCPEEVFRTRHQIAIRVLECVRGWFSGRIRLLADGAYANRSVLKPARARRIRVISRLRSDARLRSPLPPRARKGKRGRKPTRGRWLPRLKDLSRRRSSFRRERVEIYGRQVDLLVREVEGWWPPLGKVVKVIITRDPRNPKRVAYLLGTDRSFSAREVIESFAKRWTIEQLFTVAKNQLGLDSAEVRKERSVVRHAAMCMALAAWTEIWAHRFRPRLRSAAFAAKLAPLRESVVLETIFASRPRSQGTRRIAKGLAGIFTTATNAA